jgi:probable rRNA maturation factor
MTDASRDATAAGLAVDLVEESGGWAALPGADGLVEAAAAALAAHPTTHVLLPATVSIALGSDATVRKLNSTWRGKDKPTNVLSFPASPGLRDEDGRRVLGDVIVALETVLAEADAEQKPPEHHLQHLVIHGMLHLMGHDHEADGEAERMEAIEVEVLARLGVPSPYSD